LARINYLELPARDVAGLKAFYTGAFDWAFTDFGPDYAATVTGDGDLGINGDESQWTAHLLPVIQVDDLEATEEKVRAAGGEITLAAFAFPGGRRFHFKDPGGHELAAMQPDD
jgi:predicted enzyme related to lactoylglutathione lyase